MSNASTDGNGSSVDDRVAELIERLKTETHADRVICHSQATNRVSYWSTIRRVRGTVVDVAHQEGFRLDHATTRDGQGYAELVPMGDPDERVDHDGLIADGGVTEIEISGARGIVYGPRTDDAEGYVLTLAGDDGRIEARLGKHAMYTLWTEVRGVPWPEPDRPSEQDRLVRQVLHAANGADLESLREAHRVLGGPQ